MAATTRRARAGAAKPEAARPKATAAAPKKKKEATAMLRRLSSPIAAIAARLCDPTDSRALRLVAAALLVGECFLCALVIAKVPCE